MKRPVRFTPKSSSADPVGDRPVTDGWPLLARVAVHGAVPPVLRGRGPRLLTPRRPTDIRCDSSTAHRAGTGQAPDVPATGARRDRMAVSGTLPGSGALAWDCPRARTGAVREINGGSARSAPAGGSAPAERRGLCGLPGGSADGHCAGLRTLAPLADPAELERETHEPCPRLNHRPAGEAAAVRRRGAAAARALWRSGIRRVRPPIVG